MSSYESKWPSEPEQNNELVKFFQQFYEISDTPDAHEKYSEQFTKNATLIMVAKKVQGRSEILAVRQGMWEKVAKRQHKPIQVFPFGPNADEVMLHGTVNYVMKAGGEVHDLPWAARAHLTKEDGELKMDFYQVYLDSASQQPK